MNTVKVLPSYSDGVYTLVDVSSYTGKEPVLEISRSLWEAYQAHEESCNRWYRLLRDLDEEIRLKSYKNSY